MADAKSPENQSGTRAWFLQVVTQERDLRAFLRRSFPRQPDGLDVSDVIQETYVRLLALSPRQRSEVRTWRAFLFTTARNVVMDHLRRGVSISLDALLEMERSSVLEESEERSPEELVNLAQERKLLARAIQSLPRRCREVMTLRKLNGLSQKEIALRLGIAPHTVEKHISHGVRLCAAQMRQVSERVRPQSGAVWFS